MKVIQEDYFSRALKKLHRQKRVLVETVIKVLMKNPEVGDLKTCDLAGIRVYKFKVNQNLMLLAYRYNQENDVLNLLAYGSHENFYRDFKRINH